MCAAFPESGWDDLLIAFPGRSAHAIRGQANVLGCRRVKNVRNAGNVKSPPFMRDGVMGRACVKCLEWKPLKRFAKHATCAGGRRSKCSECEKETVYASRARNPGKHLEAVRRYQRRNPEVRAIHGARRRAREAHGAVTIQEIRALKAEYDNRCAYCGEEATTLDHVVPLSRDGAHSIDNIVPACRPCNSGKHARTPEEWRKAKTNRKVSY